MKLNIANAATVKIDEKFGITPYRREQLIKFIEQQYLLTLRGMGIPLVSVYQAIASFCNNIEEYTLCMHMYIFNISKIGKPIDDDSFNN